MSYSKIETLFLSNKQVFNIEDLSLYWQMEKQKDVAQLAAYYAREKRLFRLKNGLYAIISYPDTFQVAQKVLTPSYITYQTALKYWGINFQVYPSIHSASLSRRRIYVQGVLYEYHQFPAYVFFNPIGIVKKEGFTIAGAERAIVESLYINPTIGFDNLEGINIALLQEIASMYNKPRVWKALKYYFPSLTKDTASTALNSLTQAYAH